MKTLGFSPLVLWTLAACVLVCSKTQAQSVLYSFDQIETEWQKVYPGNSPVLRTLFTKYIDNGALFADDAATNTPASPGSVFGGVPGKPEVKLRFPIKNFDGESSEAFLAGQARIQLLKNTLKYYVGAREDTYREIAEFDKHNKPDEPGAEEKRRQALDNIYNKRRDSIDSMKKAVNIELFAVQMASYASSSSLNQRCAFWREAKNLAIELQFGSSNVPVFAPEFKAFSDFYTQVQTFYTSPSGFSRIPPELCSLSVVNSRGDTMKAVQEAIDSAITTQMTAAQESFQKIVQKKQQELGDLLSKSEVKIPARGLYALEKGFNDTFDLMNMVQSDLLGLYKGESALMGQLKKQIDQMNTKDAETNARQHLNTFVLLYGNLLNKLASMPDTAGLKPDSKARLEVCRVLRSIPNDKSSAGELANFQTSYNSCLRALVAEYKAGRESKKDDPTTLKFAESLSSLVSFYKTKL